MTAHGPNIIHVGPGCRLPSCNFIDKRNKSILLEEMDPVLFHIQASELLKIISENPEDKEVKNLLEEMIWNERK